MNGASFTCCHVAAIRSLTGMSQRTFAKLVGVDKMTVCRWECGKTTPIARDAVERMRRLAEFLNLDLSLEGEAFMIDVDRRRNERLLRYACRHWIARIAAGEQPATLGQVALPDGADA